MGVFRLVKEDLKNGFMVLFSGTPCQTSGLNAYVGKRLRDKLVLIDIVCHGVPSPFIWRDYINYIEKETKKNIVKVDFREKSFNGWKAHKEFFIFDDNSSVTQTLWTDMFYRHIMFRHSCEVCHYTNTRRPSDITLADYWGWENNVPDFNSDDRGVSIVLLNTNKGVSIFSKCKNLINTIPVNLKNSLQPNLKRPSVINPLRSSFENYYKRNGYLKSITRYTSSKIQNRIYRRFMLIINLITK